MGAHDVYKEAVEHNWPMPHVGVLEQTINYDVPPDYFDDLAHYDGSVIAERTKVELSARCDKEEANFLALNLANDEANFLALNLANDIVNDGRTVQVARQFHAETIQAMMEREEPEYIQRFVFDPAQENINNPDEAAL